MSSFMELIFIDSDENARHTGLMRSLDSDAETWAAFRRYRRYGVDFKRAKFLLDYHNRKGDLADTIALDDEGFRALTGHAPNTEAAYRQIDMNYWKAARAEQKAPQ